MEIKENHAKFNIIANQIIEFLEEKRFRGVEVYLLINIKQHPELKKGLDTILTTIVKLQRIFEGDPSISGLTINQLGDKLNVIHHAPLYNKLSSLTTEALLKLVNSPTVSDKTLISETLLLLESINNEAYWEYLRSLDQIDTDSLRYQEWLEHLRHRRFHAAANLKSYIHPLEDEQELFLACFNWINNPRLNNTKDIAVFSYLSQIRLIDTEAHQILTQYIVDAAFDLIDIALQNSHNADVRLLWITIGKIEHAHPVHPNTNQLRIRLDRLTNSSNCKD